MQEKVVYFLGAGFSAPLGLPVMSTFVDKSKEIRRVNPKDYGYFKDALRKITEIAIVKNYFKADLRNIEEILSILEMSAELEPEPEARSARELFVRYIADVIKASTPEIEAVPDIFSATLWWEDMFGQRHHIWADYGHFVASLHNLRVEKYATTGKVGLRWERIPNAKARYDVISLNYDCALEKVCEFLQQYVWEDSPRFRRPEPDTPTAGDGSPWLAKLHGSVDRPEDIIPPTWSKALSKSIKEQWRVAHRLLSEADHIRVLGYSLPTSDAYVQYLLKSSVVRTERETFAPLKSFHVITKDSDGDTTRRYEKLFEFRGFRFVHIDIKDYLQRIGPRQLGKDVVEFTGLEEAHQYFMNHPEV